MIISTLPNTQAVRKPNEMVLFIYFFTSLVNTI